MTPRENAAAVGTGTGRAPPEGDWLDSHADWPASAGLVARMEGCADRTARGWASKNGVRSIGGGRRGQYLFFRKDVEAFRRRGRPGRRWPAADANPTR